MDFKSYKSSASTLTLKVAGERTGQGSGSGRAGLACPPALSVVAGHYCPGIVLHVSGSNRVRADPPLHRDEFRLSAPRIRRRSAGDDAPRSAAARVICPPPIIPPTRPSTARSWQYPGKAEQLPQSRTRLGGAGGVGVCGPSWWSRQVKWNIDPADAKPTDTVKIYNSKGDQALSPPQAHSAD